MGEFVDHKDKYTVQVKGSDVIGDQRVIISHETRSVIQDIRIYGTLEEGHAYALGFIDADRMKERC